MYTAVYMYSRDDEKFFKCFIIEIRISYSAPFDDQSHKKHDKCEQHPKDFLTCQRFVPVFYVLQRRKNRFLLGSVKCCDCVHMCAMYLDVCTYLYSINNLFRLRINLLYHIFDKSSDGIIYSVPLQCNTVFVSFTDYEMMTHSYRIANKSIRLYPNTCVYVIFHYIEFYYLSTPFFSFSCHQRLLSIDPLSSMQCISTILYQI